MTSASVIAAIQAYLGQPAMPASLPTAETPVPIPLPSLDLTRLAKLAEALKWEASQVGTIPLGYPLWVTLVIKAIHRLLPWYTRPLQNFSRVCADQAEEIGYQIGVLAKTQAELRARLEQLEAQHPPHE